MDKPAPFRGREALLEKSAAGLRKRLVMLTFDDPGAFPWGGEPILMNGRNVGEITSAGYSRRHGRAVAMGYARADAPLTDDMLLAARYEVDVAGVPHAVTPHLKLG
jgi:4-methylaminobutanoate oxidase (formaldehyde-forming)